MDEVRGVDLIVEDSKMLGGKYQFQHLFNKPGHGLWSVLSSSEELPYRDGYIGTLKKPVGKSELFSIFGDKLRSWKHEI